MVNLVYLLDLYEDCTMLSQEARDHELNPLKAIKDNYEKIVLSMDRSPINDFDGILNVNIIDFLLSE